MAKKVMYYCDTHGKGGLIVSQDKPSVIVKVGNKSASLFRNAIIYRAITINEIKTLVDKKKSKIIVIENIKEKEYNNALEFIKQYITDENNKVYFYVPNNDETTTGMADELSLNIYLNIKELYKVIENECGVNLDTDISLNKNNEETIEDEEGFNSSLNIDEMLGASSSSSIDISDIQSKVIKNKDEAEISYIPNEELGIISEKMDDISDIQEEQIEESDNQDVAELKIELNETKKNLRETEIKLEETEQKYRDSMTQRESLNNIIKAIKDERDTIRKEFENFEISDIIEDPETLAEFNRLKETVEQLQLEIGNKSSLSNEEVDRLTKEKDELIKKIDELTNKNIELEGKYSELEIAKIAVDNELNTLKDDTKTEEEIKSLNDQIHELSDNITSLNNDIAKLNNDIAEKENEISILNETISKYSKIIEIMKKLLSTAVTKLSITNSLEEQIKMLISTNDKLDTELGKTKAALNDSQIKLNRLNTETERRIELATSFAKEDLESTKQENGSLRAQLQIVQSQLTAKELQYNNLIKATGMDESGANTILENNKILETMNQTLRQQMAELKTVCESLERDKSERDQSIRSLQDINGRLTTQLKAMSSGFSGGATSSLVQPFTYNNRAQVITIFGSGSYGITTTAFSIANNLSAYGRVLYIDFDMVSAKADSWFAMAPIVEGVPGVKNSGLGIIVDRGTSFALPYMNIIIKQFAKTKGGCLDYLSGFVSKPDLIKLVACDFGALMNYVGGSYAYVIIDFGRLGTSDVNDQLLKVFSNISRSNVVVTSNDRIDIRNTVIKIQKLGLSKTNMAWLINLADSTKIDKQNEQRISPASYMQIPFIDDFYGKHKDFSKDRISRDRFNSFLEKSILRR